MGIASISKPRAAPRIAAISSCVWQEPRVQPAKVDPLGIKTMNISTLKTPAFLVDLPQLRTNAEKMLARAKQQGVKFRPHVKTHKVAQLARIQHGGSVGPITVSTLAEAHVFAKAGFTDITYAVPMAEAKLNEAFELTALGVRLNLLLDGVEGAIAVERFAKVQNIRANVFLKVDCGYHRAGVDPTQDSSVQLAKFLADSPHIDFLGVLTHAGHSYAATSVQEIRSIAAAERDILVSFADKAAKAGAVCREISAGSTPTCSHAENWQDVTEIRPGNYIFFDKFQADIGSCALDDCSVSVLTRVISHHPERNQFLVDAGALALSKDAGATHLGREVGYGAVIGYPDLFVESLSQEHGIIRDRRGDKKNGLKVGSLLKIIPNHSCLSAALFETFHVVENGKLIDKWQPARGW